MRVRRLLAADVEAFRDIRLEALHQAPDAFGSSLADEANRPLEFFRSRLKGSQVLGSFDGTRLIGTAAYDRERGGNERHRALVTTVYVRPAGRGQGRTLAMLAGLDDVARADGVVQLELQVAVDNFPAITAYTKAGYQDVGILPRAILSGGRYIDEILMVKPLDD